jgi:hypothetical protein
MSTPPGLDHTLHKNVTWANKDEKTAFYNKYFKGTEWVKAENKATIDAIKKGLVRERSINLLDVKKYVEEIR